MLKTKSVHEIKTIPEKSENVKSLPDIYYIILDGYASNSCLKKYYNFDNSEFENNLRKAGFFVADKSKSNYTSSFLSLGSSLNLDYVQNLDINHDENSGDRTEVYDLIENNQIIKIMKEKGYKYIHFQAGGGPTKKIKMLMLNTRAEV